MFLFGKKKPAATPVPTPLATSASDSFAVYKEHVRQQQSNVSKRARQLADKIGEPGYTGLSVVATMTAFVAPFLDALGWNTANPNEVKVQSSPGAYDTNYTLFRKGDAAVAIEVTSVDKQPNTKTALLGGKFSHSEAQLGILTNGIEYQFHALGDDGYLSETPFASFSIDSLDIYQQDKFLTYLFRYDFSVSRLLAFADAAATSSALSAILDGCDSADVAEVCNIVFEKKYFSLKLPTVEELLDFAGR